MDQAARRQLPLIREAHILGATKYDLASSSCYTREWVRQLVDGDGG